MKEWARGLYLSKAWKHTRDAYMASRHGLCERCGESAQIVHHRKHLTPRNVNDVNVTMNWDNLEAICRDCHGIEHETASATVDGVKFNDRGELIKKGH